MFGKFATFARNVCKLCSKGLFEKSVLETFGNKNPLKRLHARVPLQMLEKLSPESKNLSTMLLIEKLILKIILGVRVRNKGTDRKP